MDGYTRRRPVRYAGALLSACKDFPFAARLNSMARQASADRAWAIVGTLLQELPRTQARQKGLPSVPDKTTALLSTKRLAGGWSQMGSDSPSRMARHWHTAVDWQKGLSRPSHQPDQARPSPQAGRWLLCPVCGASGTHDRPPPTGTQVGIDVGLKSFYTDSQGITVPNPRFLRKE